MSSATRSRGRRPTSILATILVLMTLSTTVLFVAFAAFHLSAASRAQRKDHEQYISTTLHFIRAELEEASDEIGDGRGGGCLAQGGQKFLQDGLAGEGDGGRCWRSCHANLM